MGETFIRVLLVDDDEDMYVLLRKILRQVSGVTFETAWVPTAAEAFEVVDQHFDVILLDYILGETTGLAVLHELQHGYPNTPVIMLTARGNREVDMEAMAAGAADYLSKDELTPALLERAMRYAIDRMHRMAELERMTDRLQVANARLSHKNDELEQFIYMASHDLREPLRQIMSFSEFLKRDMGEGLEGRSKQSLDFIVGAAHRMDELVAGLGKLLRASRSEITRVRVSLDECINRALEELGPKIVSTGTVITRDEMPFLRCEPTSVTHLYQNLIDNAIKYCDKEKAIIHLSAEQADSGWVFGVRDNGCGIPDEYRERIFAPFRRLHRRDQAEGTGIGLAICRKVVESHGGEIWVESVVGEGSHFRFTMGPGDLGMSQGDDENKDESGEEIM